MEDKGSHFVTASLCSYVGPLSVMKYIHAMNRFNLIPSMWGLSCQFTILSLSLSLSLSLQCYKTFLFNTEYGLVKKLVD